MDLTSISGATPIPFEVLSVLQPARVSIARSCMNQSIISFENTTPQTPKIVLPSLLNYSNPNLGAFSELPGEIRVFIWRNLVPQSAPWDDEQDLSLKKDLSILRTSKQIYSEVSAELFPKDESLHISITPNVRYDPRSWITFRTEKNEAAWNVSSLEDGISRGFLLFPYHKMRDVSIVIEAPLKENPGELICVLSKIRSVVSLLEKAIHCPKNLHVYIKDGVMEELFWPRGGQKSIHHSTSFYRDCGRDCDCLTDWMRILLQFSRLRNIKRPRVSTSNEFGPPRRARKFISKLMWAMKQDQPFGSLNGKLWDDRALQRSMEKDMKNLKHWVGDTHELTGLTAWTMFFALKQGTWNF